MRLEYGHEGLEAAVGNAHRSVVSKKVLGFLARAILWRDRHSIANRMIRNAVDGNGVQGDGKLFIT